MKKLLIAAAALSVTASVAPNLVSESLAAPKSAYCDLAKSQKNPASWNAQYGCLDTKAAAAYAQAPRPAAKRNRDPHCDLAKSQKNPVSWNERYGCLNR